MFCTLYCNSVNVLYSAAVLLHYGTQLLTTLQTTDYTVRQSSFPYLKSAELKSAPSLVLSFHPSSHRRTARVPYGVANGRALSAFGLAFKQLIVKCKKKISAICPYTEQRGSHSLGNYYLHQNLPREKHKHYSESVQRHCARQGRENHIIIYPFMPQSSIDMSCKTKIRAICPYTVLSSKGLS
jgi:hypothetical protein